MEDMKDGAFLVRGMIQWAREKGFPLSRVKIGPVEVDLVPMMPEPVDNPPETAEDPGEPELPDPDGPVTDELLFHSSGYETPEE